MHKSMFRTMGFALRGGHGVWSARVVRSIALAGWICLGLLPGMVFAQGRRPAAKDGGPTVLKDLAYGRDRKYQRLNLSLPDRQNGPVPLVIWIHGGAWVTGDKDEDNPAEALVAEGFAVASIDYRPATLAPYPAQLEDCQNALAWLRSTAKKHRIDPERVGVWGHSAGGHLATMLAMTVGSGQRSGVQAACDWSGPVDLLRFAEDAAEENRKASIEMMWRLYLGPAADNLKLRDSFSSSARQKLLQSGSPMAYLPEKMPPLLVMHGDQDRMVSVRQSRRFVGRLEQLGAPIQYIEMPGIGHDPRESPVAMKRVVSFFRNHLDLPEPPLERDSGPWRREAEEGTMAGKTRSVAQAKASEGRKVGFIDSADSTLEFQVRVAEPGLWTLRVQFANGTSGRKEATHQLTINEQAAQGLRYPFTGWDVWQTLDVQVELQSGVNTLRFGKGEQSAELDWIELTAADGEPSPASADSDAVPPPERADSAEVPPPE